MHMLGMCLFFVSLFSVCLKVRERCQVSSIIILYIFFFKVHMHVHVSVCVCTCTCMCMCGYAIQTCLWPCRV